LIQTLRIFDTIKFNERDAIKNAEKFSDRNFNSAFLKLVQNVI
jgi:hypothetical protein